MTGFTHGHPHPHPHPFLFALLNIPFGAVSGYVTVALTYSLAQSGMPVAQIGVLIAIYMSPQIWKFLWAPIVNSTLTRKAWYLCGAVLSGLGVATLAVYASKPFTDL